LGSSFPSYVIKLAGSFGLDLLDKGNIKGSMWNPNKFSFYKGKGFTNDYTGTGTKLSYGNSE
jgi:hypothetical protein